jgi:hypothetical protein
MEPQWTKNAIPSNAICNFFYAFFVVYAILFVLATVSTLVSLFYIKKLGFSGMSLAFQGLLFGALAATQSLFFYLMCDRSLLANTIKQTSEGFAASQMQKKN